MNRCVAAGRARLLEHGAPRSTFSVAWQKRRECERPHIEWFRVAFEVTVIRTDVFLHHSEGH